MCPTASESGISVIKFSIWGKRIRHIFTAPQNKEAIQPELNLFAVQMVSQPLYSARFLYWSDAFTPLF